MKFYLLIIFSVIGLNVALAQTKEANFEQLMIESKQSLKPMVLIFSGTDWCAPCIKMEKEIFSTDVFKKASENWLVYFAKFPRKNKNQLSQDKQIENNMLAEKYNLQGVFPKIVILNSESKILDELYFEKTTAEDFVSKLTKIINEK